MNLRKFLTLLLACVLISSFFGAAVGAEGEVKDVLYNGGFETVNGENKPDTWGIGSYKMDADQGFFWETEKPYEGKRSVRMLYSGKNLTLQKSEANLMPGTKVTVSFTAKMLSADMKSFAIDSGFKDINEEAIPNAGEKFNITGLFQGRWVEKAYTFTIPENAETCTFSFRLAGSGEVLIDAVKWTGVHRKSVAEVRRERIEELEFESLPPMKGEAELLTNTGFDELDAEGYPVNYGSYGAWAEGNKLEIVDGNSVIKITGGNNPWINTSVPYKDGYTWQVSADVKTVGSLSGKGFGFKFEMYDAEGNYIKEGAETKGYCQNTDNQWKRVSFTYTPLAGLNAEKMSIYFRLHGKGTVYIDNVSCYIVGEAKAESFTFVTDDVFYYSDQTEDGYAQLKIREAHWEEGMTADYAFIDPATDEVLLEKKGLTFDEDVIIDSEYFEGSIPMDGRYPYEGKQSTFTYPMSLFKEKTKEYRVTCTVYDGEGNAMKSFYEKVAMYDRPKKLSADGYFLKDGKPFIPVFGYHTSEEDFPVQKEIGINTILGSYWYYNADYPERFDRIMAAAEEHDYMILASLYLDMGAAGSIANYENTYKMVHRLKDNPRIIAYMIMDEPSLNRSGWDDLWWSYRLIHSIDPDTPIYMVDCVPTDYAKTARYADISVIDPYPGGEKDLQVTIMPDKWSLVAQEGIGYGQPLWAILQTYESKELTPDINSLRNNIYQTLFRGVGAYGYFSISDAFGIEEELKKENENLYGTQLWEDMKVFAAWEQKELNKAFILNEYPVLDEELRRDVWYRIWQADDGNFYAILLSKSDTETAEVTIPLESFDGSIKIGEYTAELICGGENKKISGNGSLSHTLLPIQSALFKIVPKEKVDMSGVTNTRFKDLGNYRWARPSIDALDKNAIMNDNSTTSFAPAREITRGELAYALVRALGLTGEGKDTFADIRADKFYAKEIAIGKEAGILQGIGDNLFNPEEEITRQDLMTIVARGMKLAKGLSEGSAADLSAFTDQTAVADYALLDIAAMVRENIVRGNADGTLNPTGNTTRAEAACIIDRVMQWDNA